MNKTEIKLITEIDEAKKIWDELSYNEDIFDTWNFRYAYFKLFKCPLLFYVAYDKDIAVGLLALQETPNKPYLEFFGGQHMSNNQIFTKKGYESCRKILIENVKKPIDLDFIKHRYSEFTKTEEKKYFDYDSDFKKYINLEDFLQKQFSSKTRNKLKSQMKKINNLNIKVELNNIDHLTIMKDLNIRTFGERSHYHFPYRIEFYQELVKIFDFQIITIYINDKIQSVGLSVLYDNCYYGLSSGTNREITNLSKYLILKKIEQAINLKVDRYFAGLGNCNWKEAYGFKKIPQYVISQI